jgi:hypothetical protein
MIIRKEKVERDTKQRNRTEKKEREEKGQKPKEKIEI